MVPGIHGAGNINNDGKGNRMVRLSPSEQNVIMVKAIHSACGNEANEFRPNAFRLVTQLPDVPNYDCRICPQYGMYRICDRFLLAFAKVHTRSHIEWKDFVRTLQSIKAFKNI